MNAVEHANRALARMVGVPAVVVVLAVALEDAPMETLPKGSMESDARFTFTDNAVTQLTVDSQSMRVEAVDRDYAFSIPAANTYRFEVRKNDFGWKGDKRNNNRRSELISEGDRYGSGDTLWSSFAFVVGPEHTPFDPGGDVAGHNIIAQWHSVDVEAGRGPIFAIDLTNGNLNVNTRSDSTGPRTRVTHYSKIRPTDRAVHNVVVAALLGEKGHLDVWLDGTQIVDTDSPIGYYLDDDGERALAYPHWGIYQKNVDNPAIVYHANIEWGLTDLSRRVARPLSVTTPPGGWV